jgi:hypothetical protein
MKLGDYSPPTAPARDQQRCALDHGLGRTLQWALAGKLADEPLLEACLHDRRFDMEVEGPRGEWLWRILQAVGAVERCRVPILHALYELSDDSGAQLCELARHYAATGDEAFRTRLYEIVEQKPVPDSPWLGEEDIVRLDGRQALLFAARLRGRLLADRPWEWHDRSLVDFAMEHLGAGRVQGVLETSSDDAVRRFWDNWRRDSESHAEAASSRTAREESRERLRATSVDDVVRAAAGPGQCYWLRGWGMHAEPAHLQAVLPHLWSAAEPHTIVNLLRIFAARALPEFDGRLIELCRHDDEEIKRRAYAALQRNAHPLVRQFAQARLRAHDGAAVALFAKNYQRGDEREILEALELPEDACALHWLLMDVVKMLEENADADPSQLGVAAYALTPCATCRYYATRMLLNRRAAPDWLIEECRYDSCADCRELVGQA